LILYRLPVDSGGDLSLEELQVVELLNRFYRDSFGKILFIMAGFCSIIVILAGISIYLHFSKPAPLVFSVDDEWRVQAIIPLNQPYLSRPDLLQWVGDVLPKIFVYDFSHYNDQLKQASQYFTPRGWKVFLNQLNNYANYNTVLNGKVFVNAEPIGAPVLLSSGLLSGRYAWWVQLPIKITYSGYKALPVQYLTLQVLVVRVPTLANLSGIGIDNVIVATNIKDRLIENG
jgi:intracellular multiplication protein IcmL